MPSRQIITQYHDNNTKYFGKVCVNHPDIKGERYRNGSCVKCSGLKYRLSPLRRLKAYDLTEQEYLSLLTAQGHKCAICNTTFVKAPHVDHCHHTNHIRGLLCGNCNKGLGLFQDDRVLLESAINYLSRSAK